RGGFRIVGAGLQSRGPGPRNAPAPLPHHQKVVPMRQRHWQTFGLAAVALALLAGPAHAQTTLRYQFKSGEKLQYGLSQDMKMTMNLAGMDIEMKLKQSMDMDWDVQNVDAQGNARVQLKFGHVRLKLDSTTGNAEFDSKKNTEEPEDP